MGWVPSNTLSCYATGGLSYTSLSSYESLNSSTTDTGKHGASGRLLCVEALVLKRREIQRGIRSA